MPDTTPHFIRPGEPVPPGATYVECRAEDGVILVEVKARDAADTRVLRQADLVRYLPAGVVS